VKLASPAYVAVSVSVPGAAPPAMRHDALPPAEMAGVVQALVPSLIVTVPLGVPMAPPPGATATVTV